MWMALGVIIYVAVALFWLGVFNGKHKEGEQDDDKTR